jgi:hypothetical protein
MVANPKNWMCEGEIIYNSDGSPKWVYSGEDTTKPPYPVAGLPIDKHACNPTKGALLDNVDTLPVRF